MGRKKIKVTALILVASLFLDGCALMGKVADYADENGVEETINEISGEVMTFVDAHGEMHETTINPNIAKCEYDKDLFVLENDRMTYSDDAYETMQGIDVSHHQGDIDWNAVKEAGFDFVILRIGYRGYGEEGTLSEDTRFDEYYNGAKEAGLLVGAYFFAQAINEDEAIEEANFVIELLQGKELDLPVVYDPESILDDDARTDGISGDQFTNNTAAFCRAMYETGHEPMIYANMVWEAEMLDLESLSAYPIWYADYEIPPQTPYAFTCWQYNEKGSVPGVEGDCDLDIWIRKK